MVGKKKYSGEDGFTVYFDSNICTHSANCVNGLKEVFNPQKRPWVDLSGADVDRIKKQIEACPSGALSYEGQKQPDASGESVLVDVIANGPMAVHASLQIKMPNGDTKEIEGPTYFCRCGMSAEKPFCDGSHNRSGFQG